MIQSRYVRAHVAHFTFTDQPRAHMKSLQYICFEAISWRRPTGRDSSMHSISHANVSGDNTSAEAASSLALLRCCSVMSSSSSKGREAKELCKCEKSSCLTVVVSSCRRLPPPPLRVQLRNRAHAVVGILELSLIVLCHPSSSHGLKSWC